MSKEMTPKEALEKLCKVKIYQKEASVYDYLGKEVYKEEINLITQALERKKELENENEELTNTIAETHYKMVRYKKFIDFLKINFNIVLDSKLRISDDLECVQTFIYDLPKNTTIKDMFEIIEEILKDAK